MKVIFLSILISFSLIVQANDNWPSIVFTFSGQAPYSYKQQNYQIDIKPLPIPGGSGGRHYEVILFKDGTILGKTVTEAVFAFSVLNMDSGLPQLEAWSSGGAEKYVRLLYRWNGNQFSVVRIDDYIKSMRKNNQGSYIPQWAKEYGFALTYRSTRTPQ